MTKVRVSTAAGQWMTDFESMEAFEAWLEASDMNASDFIAEVIEA